MKIVLSKTLCLLFLGSLLWAQSEPRWLRYPALSPDGKRIVFTYRGDLYRVPSQGGEAVPLTIHKAHDFMPVWSPDGKQVAFASERYGNFDLFLVAAEGGEVRRLTGHSAQEYPYAFSQDGRYVYFGAARLDDARHLSYPSASQPELYRVPVTGGRVEQVLTTPAEQVRFSRDGQRMIYQDRKGGENAWRKHHRSAIARDIWIWDRKAGTHTKVTAFDGEDRDPVFSTDEKSFYYLSEESGSFNVHRMSLPEGRSRQITTFAKHPVRFLSRADDGTLCFGYDGEIYLQKEGGKARKVPIRIGADVKESNEDIVPVGKEIRQMAVSPNGKEIAFLFRGEVFAAAVEGTAVKRITSTPEPEHDVSFSPDGKALLYASERGNSWKIYQTRRLRQEEPYFYAATALQETPLVENDRESYQPAWSPDGKEIAFIEDRMNLKVLNLESKEVRTLLTDRELFSMREHDQHFQWSPDGRFLLFNYAVPGSAYGEIGLVPADGKGKPVNLTQSGFEDRRAKWILGGKAMLWFSNRDGLKSVAQSGSSESDVYAQFFTREAWDRYRLSKEEAALVKEQEEKKEKEKAEAGKEKKEAKKEDKVEPLTIEWEGLPWRKARLTVHSSSLGDALIGKDGETLYYLARFEKGMNLWSTQLRTRETKMLVALNADSGSMEWDKEQKSIFLLADGAISKIDPATGKREPVTLAGEVLRDATAERRAMFEHVWRRTQKTFYTAGFHGADWDGLKSVYAAYLPHIGNSHEFSELLSELLGELNVSHSGSAYNPQNPAADATASLGLFYDYAYRGDGYRIEEVLAGGPLDKTGIDIQPGTILEAIDGVKIPADTDLSQYLNRKAGQAILLTFATGDKKQEITAKPISPAEENRLLYRRWVERNRREVDRLSQGRLGYVHIPGMDDRSYRTTYEEVMGKYADRRGMVIDTRYNGGGDLVADLAMFLSGRKFFDYATDSRNQGYEPSFRWTRPTISLANEANYSDGHCYAFAYKDLKIGKLVGMPVPGTCTFAGWEMLPENGLRWGVPPLGVKTMDGKYLENRQTVPDIQVRNDFDVVAKGRDQQLEAAVTTLLKELQ